MNENDLQSDLAGDSRISAFVAQSDVPQLTDYLQRLGRAAMVATGGVQEAVAHCRKQPASSMLMVDISRESHPLIALSELMQAAGPACRVLVLGEQNDVNLYRSLLGEGIVDYLLKPIAFDQLAQVLHRVDEDQSVLASAAGRTVAITGASGGCGTSTVVAGLAMLLARQGQAPQVVVDFDRRQADIPLLFGLDPSDGLRAALEAGDGDPRLLLRTIARVNERIFLLSQQPGQEEQEQALESGQVLQLGAALCRLFGLSLWDIPAQRDQACLDVLRHAETRVVLTDLTVQDARKVHRLLQEIGDESAGQRLILVGNACRQAGQPAVPRAQFEEFVGHRLDVNLPWAGPALSASLLRGPLALDANAAFRDAVSVLADTVMGRRPSAPHRQGSGLAARLRALFARQGTTARAAT